jgi:hypothetical protein
MVGDDLPDLPVLERVGLPVAVANAVPEVRARARWITTRRGGKRGGPGVRRALLQARGTWDNRGGGVPGREGGTTHERDPAGDVVLAAGRRYSCWRPGPWRGPTAWTTPSSEAVELLQGCRGRVIVTGVGKSGIIARKIAATLTSTGTPATSSTPSTASTGTWGSCTATTWGSSSPSPGRPPSSTGLHGVHAPPGDPDHRHHRESGVSPGDECRRDPGRRGLGGGVPPGPRAHVVHDHRPRRGRRPRHGGAPDEGLPGRGLRPLPSRGVPWAGS